MEAPDSENDCLEIRKVSLAESPVFIGRASLRVLDRTARRSNLYLANRHISKEHARLIVHNEEVLVEDLNSSFGTIRNNDLLVPFNRIPLREGDELGFVLNRSLSCIQDLRNNNGLLKTVPLSSLVNPKVQIQFKVARIDLDSHIIVLQAVGHSCDSHPDGAELDSHPCSYSAGLGCEATKSSTNVSFSNLLNSDSCQCTDVSDSNESICVTDNRFQFTDSEAESTLSESESSGASVISYSDEESEILVNVGPAVDLGEDKSDLVNLIDYEESDYDDSKASEDAITSVETKVEEGIIMYRPDAHDETDLSEHSDLSLEENESESSEEDDLIADNIDACIFANHSYGDGSVWVDVVQDTLQEEPASRKRRHEEIEDPTSGELPTPAAKKSRINGILWEVGKGAMYVTGTLMALVAYGGYLVNSQQ